MQKVLQTHLQIISFTSSYIGLVRQGCTKEAKIFWQTWESDHTEVKEKSCDIALL